MNRRAELAMEKRADVSMFMVHLTRDDRNVRTEKNGGNSAKGNFVNILGTRTIAALDTHCLHGDQIRRLPERQRKKFYVSCFTDTPLSEINRLLDVGPRRINLEPYGFVFRREFLYEKGAQPAIYINDYGPNKSRAAVDKILGIGKANRFTGLTWPLLPLVNVMHDGHDFAWEREWRVIGDVEFEHKDLVCVILPEDEFQQRDRMARIGVPAIDPSWCHERLILEFSMQQRATKKAWKPAKPLKLVRR